MRQFWQTICLAHQGDTKPCADPCLHCARIEEAIAREYPPTPDDVRAAMSETVATLNRWLAHQYSHQEQFGALQEARDSLRAVLEK